MDQLNLFDFLPIRNTEVPCGYIEDADIDSVVGRELEFSELKNMIGKKAIHRMHNHYRVVKITDYYEQCDVVYKRVRELPPNNLNYGEYVNSYIHDVCGIKECMECYEPAFTYDRVAYSDSENARKGNCNLSASYCKGGVFYDQFEDGWYAIKNNV